MNLTPIVSSLSLNQIKQCLAKIASMDVNEVLQHYGFAEELVARNLKTRATGACVSAGA